MLFLQVLYWLAILLFLALTLLEAKQRLNSAEVFGSAAVYIVLLLPLAGLGGETSHFLGFILLLIVYIVSYIYSKVVASKREKLILHMSNIVVSKSCASLSLLGIEHNKRKLTADLLTYLYTKASSYAVRRELVEHFVKASYDFYTHALVYPAQAARVAKQSKAPYLSWLRDAKVEFTQV